MKKNKILLKTALIIAPLCLPALSSCSKENATEESGPEGVRVISVQFGKATKAAFGTDGVTPNFAEGDKIRVSDGAGSEVCAVSVDGDGNATFTTTLSGELRAIYPSEAAALTGAGRFDPIVSSSPRFKVPASQDGTVAKAIIAEATIAEGSSEAVFDGQTALFEITPPAGVTSFTITSLKAAEINTAGSNKKVITVGDGSTALGTFYAALKPGVNLTDLSFEYTTDASHGALKGIPNQKITGNPNETTVNTIYKVDEENWHPYVKIGNLKWATMNIGAASEADCGYHFSWGYPVGCVRDTENDRWVLASDHSVEVSFGTAPFHNRFVSATEDIVIANWGGAWRTPTGNIEGEYDVLVNGTTNVWETVDGVNGRRFTDNSNSNNSLFFPVGGRGEGNGLIVPDQGWYWSSSFLTTNVYSYDLIFDETHIISRDSNNSRYLGLLIRPVADL